MRYPRWELARASLEPLTFRFPQLRAILQWLRPAEGTAICKATEAPLVREFVGVAPGAVLEVGFGNGAYSGELVTQSSRYFGIDISLREHRPPWPLRRARRVNPRLGIVCGDAEALPFRNE